MPSAPVPSEKQAEIEDLERAIREAVDAEIGELAANLATTDDAHLFGTNEFTIRALAHKIAAKAIEQHLARKKTRMAKFAGSRRKSLFFGRTADHRQRTYGDFQQTLPP
jgi:hypothetical protein